MSWVIVEKETGRCVYETYQRSVTQKVNTEKYRVLTYPEYIHGINQLIEAGDYDRLALMGVCTPEYAAERKAKQERATK